MHYKQCKLRNQITFFQVTGKVTHYVSIYKKVSEVLFQIRNTSYFVFPFIRWQLGSKCRDVENQNMTQTGNN